MKMFLHWLNLITINLLLIPKYTKIFPFTNGYKQLQPKVSS
jgi:hypothetical protein